MNQRFAPSFVDREMFAYNARYQAQSEKRAAERAKLAAHLAQAENRIGYALEFADTDCEESRVKAMTAFYKWVGIANDEGHY